MKKIFISIALISLTYSFSIAGDNIAPTTQASSSKWNGFYIGVQAGHNWGDADVNWIDDTNTADEISYKGPTNQVDGGLAGVYGGYNYIFENGWLVGIEGEINKIGANDTQSTNYENGDDYPGDVEQKWDGSLKIRVGKIVGTFLSYITGGVARGGFHVKQYAVYDKNEIYFDKDMTLNGWTMGAGIEWSVSHNIHFRIQYRYTDYNDDTKRDNWTYNGDTSDNFTDATLDYNSHQLSLGLTYQF